MKKKKLMQTLAFLSPWRRSAITGLTVFFSLLLYYLFPADIRLDSNQQGIIAGAAFFLLVPILYVRIVLKDPVQLLGFQASTRRFGWAAVVFSVIPAIVILVLIARLYPMGEQYTLPVSTAQSFPLFLFYEVFIVGALIFLYEVFFRGFVMLLWLEALGFWSVLLQAILFIGTYSVLHGGVSWQDVPLLFTAVISGYIAFYTKSIWYSWFASWLFLFLADAYFLAIR